MEAFGLFDSDEIHSSLVELLGCDGDLASAGEAIASMLTEFTRCGDAFLILSKSDGWGYVQFHSHDDGSLYAEATSNAYMDEAHRLSRDDEMRLRELGWAEPTCGVPITQGEGMSPNWHRLWEPPVPVGSVALMAARTLTDVFGVMSMAEVEVTFFRR